jgi:nucleoside-diphosphate-sugar epimerase
MTLEGKTLLITGIGGFIGLRTAELALQKGMKVRGLQRSPDKAHKAKELGADVMVGSVTDANAAKLACEGVDIVLHAAAIIQAEGNRDEFQSINVGGTITMAEAAKAAGVPVFVNLSSAMVYGVDYPKDITEDGPLYQGDNPYCKTKIEAEIEVLKFNDPPTFGVINFRPGDVYGPNAPSWVVQPLQLMQAGKFVLVNGGRGVINHLYVDNLVDGIFLAIEKQSYGETFNLTDGCQTSWKDYYLRLANLAGMPKPVSMPAFLARAAAKLANLAPETIDIVTRPHAYSIQKARTTLGYQPRITLDEGMTHIADWLKNSQLVPNELTKL